MDVTARFLMNYSVWSTQKMYLLDRKKRIIAKPVTEEKLKESITPLKQKKKKKME